MLEVGSDSAILSPMSKTHKTIEEASCGATYQNEAGTFTVYEHGVYPRHSVLAGQPSRKWLGEYDSLAEAQAAHPDAEVIGGSSYREPSLKHLPDGPDDGFWDGFWDY